MNSEHVYHYLDTESDPWATQIHEEKNFLVRNFFYPLFIGLKFANLTKIIKEKRQNSNFPAFFFFMDLGCPRNVSKQWYNLVYVFTRVHVCSFRDPKSILEPTVESILIMSSISCDFIFTIIVVTELSWQSFFCLSTLVMTFPSLSWTSVVVIIH